jgi:hypothetical protein
LVALGSCSADAICRNGSAVLDLGERHRAEGRTAH